MKTPAANPSGPNGRFKPLLRWLAGASTLLYACSRFMPCNPPVRGNLIDDSWMQALHFAFVQHLQFGRDFILTFGPWGFLYGGYLPATHPLAAVVWLALSVVFWWAAGKVARHFTQNEFAAWAWLLGFTGLAGLTLFQNIDVCLHGFVLLWLLLYFFVEERPFTPAQAALVVCLGLFGLVKFSILLEAIMILALIATDTVFRQRRFPWIALVFAASVLCFWIAAGQHLSSFGPFIVHSLQITGGYTEAMMLTGPDELLDVTCFLAGAAMVCGLAGVAGWAKHKCWGLLPAAGVGLMLFLAFKYGYVRHDGHEVAATMALLLVSLAVLAVAWPVVKGRGQKWIAAGLAPVMLIVLFTAVTFSRNSGTGLIAGFVRTLGVQNVLAPLELPFRGGRLRRDYETYLADMRSHYPLPAIKGTIDAYPFDQATLFAHGLDYRPRPIIQSYTAYTPELAELNAAHLRGGRAPDQIFFQLFNLDDRYPSLDDGLSWPEMLARYDVQETESLFALLKRSPTPRNWRLTPLEEVPVQFGEQVMVPATNGLIWAKMDIGRTAAGDMAATLFKVPVLWLTVTVRDGRAGRYRLVPGLARTGFLLSPLVESCAAFSRLNSVGGRQRLSGQEITSIRIGAGDADGPTVCYRSPMQIRFYRLEIAEPDSAR